MSEVEAIADLFPISDGRQTATAKAPSAAAAVAVTAARTPHALLVEAVRRGDQIAFGRLYELYGPMVHGILLARVPWIEVDDLVQDVFLHAFKRLHTLRDDNAFGGWLAMITRNRAIDYHRRSREMQELSPDLAQAASRAVDAEASEAIALIRNLPEAYRETLILRFVEGMTGPEIAERTGLTPASVRVNLHRGMKLLREKMGVKEET
ncbi:MAG TPA: sigma-70 family RNA polymerase sigma factor [Pyrinomonadaceae bacterium]|jgi:RNA polymerase sigma-70 factor (ECF subfamily)|nr:sigma-70 family RNA polymerase sigma factor [Pyrinomonadaceae bacterium]